MGYTFTAGEIGTKAKLDQTIPSQVMQAGALSVAPVANTQTSVWVAFPTPFASVPRIAVSPVSIVPGSQVKGVGWTGATRFGFTLWLLRTNTTKTTIMWQAFADQPTPFVTGQPAPATLLNVGSASPLDPAAGTVSINAGGSVPVSATVTFPVAFASTPVVCVSPTTSVPGIVRMSSLSSLTATGFTGWIYRTGTATATNLNWVALGRF